MELTLCVCVCVCMREREGSQVGSQFSSNSLGIELSLW